MDAIQRQLVGMDYFSSRSVLENDVNDSGRAEPIKRVPKPGEAVPLRFAASLLPCLPEETSTETQNEEDYEVLIQLRGSRGFIGSLTVFPGGGLDASDGDPAWRNLFLKSIAKAPHHLRERHRKVF
ncbi:hypothetical protein M427DRAFT_475192 [Gonapodya prolifera JEL478]|uniref:Nudix hydrolase domain-containing protein n=1 Tax=Gonapodya prolifera (strain JEL478) TaxID=1344416 RepID=A0A139A190_GONPJ|nr:hypothetical protein M427DRAFT_475192 [Gonapodya prolifera JEL478]|eukprot:KXS10546.1 hypothetical protein M427DRAFT_475192 [Gonapodya prolifera JEL478]